MGKKDKSLKAAQPQVTKGVVSKAVPVSAKSSKSKKAAPPPPPSSSSSSEDDSSESEAEVPKAATNGKTVQNTNISAGPDSDSDSESDSDSDSVSSSDASSHQEKPKTAKAATVNAVSSTAKSDSDSSDSDDSGSDSDSEKAVPAPKQVPTKKDDESSSSDSDSDSDDSPATKVVQKVTKETSDSEDSDDDESDVSMKDGTVPATTGKRKAEVEAVEPAKKAKVSEDASLNAPSSTIWIGNLSWNVDDDWLKTEFETYGELVSARVQMDRNSGRSRGFGYVEFKEMSAAQAAVDDHTKEIDGRAPRVDFAPPRSAPDPTKRAKAFDDKVSEPSSILFVGNLSFDATEDGCWEAFGDFGEVLSVRLPTDRETQQPKGFGYVEFGDQASAIKAFEALRGKELFGRAIRLDYSHPRDPSSGSRGGRGGDRGRGGFRGGDRGGRGGPRGGFRGGRGGDRGRGAARGRGAGARAFEGKKITF